LGQERIDKLFNRVEAGTLNSALIALADFVRLDRSRENKAVELLHRAVFSRERDAVVYGLSGIERWRLFSGKGSVGKVPQRLKQAAITIAAEAREPWLSSALYVAGKFVEDGDLSDNDKRELLAVLEKLQTETAYTSWETSDARTINITHIRAQCVKLAEQLQHAGVVHSAITFWIDRSKDDPMPEVRYALADLQE